MRLILIDTDDVYKVLTEYYHHKDEAQHKALKEALGRCKAIEAVPAEFHDKCQQIEIKRRMALEEELAKIIKCKDCVHWEEYHQREYKGEGMCKESGYLDRRAEDFCSLAERKAESVEIKPSDTYTTGHNENETAAFEKLKMIEPLDRAVVFRKSKDELYIKVSDIGKVCDPYKDHDVKQYTTEEIAKKIIEEANKACTECQEENCWECEYRNWRGVKR